ncbi:lysophospholipid acyltransferase family protein [Eudoraea chungangensis]|uniref:lysophospholipid acyltransferase family protein n=1 Tax=Eudoraea chungangensis TaxID=1481905 RepID=UPI0023ED939B|nr:lysophospholipid acyltransferase family protein [Eudoraea chungangensis]
MQLLVFIFAYPFLWLISILPHKLFYLFSDIIFLAVYYLIGYRKKVVFDNLTLAFPDKTDEEKKQIRKEFYKHMCDMFLETIRTMSIKEESLKKQYLLPNIDLLLEYEKERSVLVLFAHYGNWEWSIIVNRFVKSKGYAVYQKIGNVYFDRLIKKIRATWNTTPISQKETVITMMRNFKSGVKGIYGIVSDQSPQVERAQYWTEFMGIKVPVYNSPEILARKFDHSVVFAKVTKLSRGHYCTTFIPIAKEGSLTTENEITETFLRLSEEEIRENPQYYLWTHKRWKHRDKAPKTFQ